MPYPLLPYVREEIMNLIKWFFMSKYKKTMFNLTVFQQNKQRVHFENGLILDFEKNIITTEKEEAEKPHSLNDFISCSACKTEFNIYDNCTELFKYCPNCGAKMEVNE